MLICRLVNEILISLLNPDDDTITKGANVEPIDISKLKKTETDEKPLSSSTVI